MVLLHMLPIPFYIVGMFPCHRVNQMSQTCNFAAVIYSKNIPLMAHFHMPPARRSQEIVRAPPISIHSGPNCAELGSNWSYGAFRAVWYAKSNQIIGCKFNHSKNINTTPLFFL